MALRWLNEIAGDLASGHEVRRLGLGAMAPPRWHDRFINGAPGQTPVKRLIQAFCGIEPLKVHGMGPVRGSSQAKRWARLSLAYHAQRHT